MPPGGPEMSIAGKIEELTVLAEGTSCALLGDVDGSIFPCTLEAYRDLFKPRVRQPVYHPLPPAGTPRIGRLYMQVDIKTMLPESVLLLQHILEPVSGISIYAAYEAQANVWHLREIRGSGGRYFIENYSSHPAGSPNDAPK